ncbi:carboxypeptidase-like regulatory domain-containing protein [Algoriphagus mannitolivorans]|uniref:carboxypeptidase-like regulatory domain-containing protein n=1 Tax=Algoriphagus mannitolivorans TaxID=226504 RepID=UPI000425069D|nr:carboxypeptidase-like regulatory domain-containing protein [Algoriphagus mannitolivorans]
MRRPVFLVFLFLINLPVFAQSTYSGNVLDALDKKYLEGVSLQVKGKSKAFTNERGYFQVKASIGDTLVVSFPGFLEKELTLTSDRFLLIEIHDKARLLPTFQVEAEPYRFRFKDGKLYLAENEPESPRSLSKAVGVQPLTNENLHGGIAISGVLSSLTRRNRELKAYEEKLEKERRRAGYLEVIDADSVRNQLMEMYDMDRSSWDKMIVRFNEFHQSHEFLDWSSERVLASLKEFVRLEAVLMD